MSHPVPLRIVWIVAQPAVEALDEAVLCRLARLDEAQRDAPLVGLLVERSARQLGAVVQHDLLGRLTALHDHAVQDARHAHSGKRRIHFDRERLPREGVDDGEEPELPAPRNASLTKSKAQR